VTGKLQGDPSGPEQVSLDSRTSQSNHRNKAKVKAYW